MSAVSAVASRRARLSLRPEAALGSCGSESCDDVADHQNESDMQNPTRTHFRGAGPNDGYVVPCRGDGLNEFARHMGIEAQDQGGCTPQVRQR